MNGFGDWLLNFFLWLNEKMNRILDALENPLWLIDKIAQSLAVQLPDTTHMMERVSSEYRAGMANFLHFIGLLNYFVNIGFMVEALGFILMVETLLMFIRLWRVVRSMVT